MVFSSIILSFNQRYTPAVSTPACAEHRSINTRITAKPTFATASYRYTNVAPLEQRPCFRLFSARSTVVSSYRSSNTQAPFWR